MSCLDVFLSSLNNEEIEIVKNDIEGQHRLQMPLMSWDIFMEAYGEEMKKSKKQTEYEEVSSMAKQYNWSNDLKKAFSEIDYQAIIITDVHQNIIWVNDGFTKMTGYAKKVALQNTPRFLQGEKTSPETKKRIRQKIAKHKPFKEIIVNHKKDNSTYICEVNIIPLYGKDITHYIAFERKVG